MAMTYQNFASLGVNLNRQKYGPLDISNVFTSAADLQYYLTKGAYTEGVSEYWYKNANEKIVPYPYEGQVLATVIDGVVNVYTLSLDAEGNFQTQEIAGKIEVDGKTIVKDAEGKLSIVAPVNPDEKKTYNFSYANGVYSWVEVDTATAAGQAQAIQGLTDRTVALEEAVNGKGEGEERVAGLVEKVAALEAADNATQAELDAYKEVVTGAIADALAEAKKYADDNDADTVYDDTALANRVKALEDEERYDETPLANRVGTLETVVGNAEGGLVKDVVDNATAIANEKTRAEAAEKALGERIDAIDFVDEDELEAAIETALEPVNEAIEAKAAQTDLEALQARVEAFLDNTGAATEAIDTLQDLINYINTHDDADINGILASIQAIENKLVGVDSTVAAYVTAAIEALNIGDYAKAADLTALAGRVEALEGKPFDTYATKTEVQEVDAKFAQYTTTSDLNGLLADKANADSVVANDTFESFKTANTTAIATAKQEAIDAAKAAEEAKGYAVATEVAATYATKAELETHEEEITNELLAYAKTADVNTELAKKVESATIAHAVAADPEKGIEAIPEGITKEGTTLKIVVDAPTRAETTQMIADKVAAVTGGESAAAVKLLVEAEAERSIAKDEAHDAAIAKLTGEATVAGSVAEAKALAQKGVDDAAAVASDLDAAELLIAGNAREIETVKGTISTVNETLSGKVTALENKDIELAGLISGLTTTVNGNASTIGEHTAAITALQNKDTELAGQISGVDAKFANYTDTEGMNKAIDDKIAAIPAVDFTGYATETYVTDAIAVVNEEVGKKANAADVYTITAADAKFMTEAQVKSVVDKVVADVSDTDTIEGLVTLVNYVHDNAGDIAQLVSDVATNKTATETNATAIAKNAEDIIAINDAIAAIVQPKASTEVTVAEDGTLGIGEVSTDKLVQGSKTLVLNGGDAEVKAE